MSTVVVGVFSAHPRMDWGFVLRLVNEKNNYIFLINFPMRDYNCWQLQLEH